MQFLLCIKIKYILYWYAWHEWTVQSLLDRRASYESQHHLIESMAFVIDLLIKHFLRAYPPPQLPLDILNIILKWTQFDMEWCIETNNWVQFVCAYEMSSPTDKRNNNKTKKVFFYTQFKIFVVYFSKISIII